MIKKSVTKTCDWPCLWPQLNLVSCCKYIRTPWCMNMVGRIISGTRHDRSLPSSVLRSCPWVSYVFRQMNCFSSRIQCCSGQEPSQIAVFMLETIKSQRNFRIWNCLFAVDVHAGRGRSRVCFIKSNTDLITWLHMLMAAWMGQDAGKICLSSVPTSPYGNAHMRHRPGSALGSA